MISTSIPDDRKSYISQDDRPESRPHKITRRGVLGGYWSRSIRHITSSRHDGCDPTSIIPNDRKALASIPAKMVGPESDPTESARDESSHYWNAWSTPSSVSNHFSMVWMSGAQKKWTIRRSRFLRLANVDECLDSGDIPWRIGAALRTLPEG